MSVSSEWCKINTETFTLVIYPGFGQPPKPFEFGSDQIVRIMRDQNDGFAQPIS